MKRTAKSFPVYLDYAKAVNKLSDDEAGKLFKALLEYAGSNHEPQLEGSLYAVFAIMQNQLDRDTEKYEQKCAQLRENGSKGGRPAKNKEPDANQEKPNGFSSQPNKPDTDTDTVTDTVTDSYIESKADKPSSRNPIDYEAVKKLYNQCCPSLSRCTVLSDARKKAIKARFASGYTMQDFETLFRKTEASDFLKGRNERNWTATFDWLIKDASMAKVLSGNYDNNKGAKQNGTTEGYSEQNKQYGTWI